MTTDRDALVKDAMKKAFALGQTYWQQADSEYSSQNIKSKVTAEKFNTLLTETIAHITAPADAPVADKFAWVKDCQNENWDSYGALAVSDVAVSTARRISTMLATKQYVVPVAHGGVQIECHAEGIDLEIEIDAAGGISIFSDPTTLYDPHRQQGAPEETRRRMIENLPEPQVMTHANEDGVEDDVVYKDDYDKLRSLAVHPAEPAGKVSIIQGEVK